MQTENQVIDFNYFVKAREQMNSVRKQEFYDIENKLEEQKTQLGAIDHLLLDRYNELKQVVDIILYQEEKELNPVDTTSNNFYLKLRKNRDLIKHSTKIKKILIGDILEFVYYYKNLVLIFNGICIAIRKKSFVMPDLSFILRNIIITTGIELTTSFFYNKGYKMHFFDFRRKFYNYNKNKIYFIRERLNRESRI